MHTLSRDDGFTLTELLVATTVMLLVMGGALTTVRNALNINETATQMADANQNLRAGTNTLIRDLLMAGRIIGAEGISVPGGMTFYRPGPTEGLTFDLVSSSDPNDPTKQLPSITTGYHLGPKVNGSFTDIVTIITIDEFMPVVTTPPLIPNAPTAVEGTISTDGSKVTFGSNSVWINGDKTNDTPKIEIGDLVFFKGQYGNAIQTVTAKDSTSITFEAGKDYFNFNPVSPATSASSKPLYNVKQINPGTDPTYPPAALLWPQVQPVPAGVTVLCASPGVLMSPTTPFCSPVTVFKASMITYYVDNSDPNTPRLTRLLNHRPKGCTAADAGSDACPAKFEPQALAGIVEDIDLTYDIYDGTCNPTEVPFDPALLPWKVTCNAGTPPLPVSIAYFENMIRKVNVHVGVRSETKSKPANDYVRNHISSSVNVRSLTAVDRYNAQIQ